VYDNDEAGQGVRQLQMALPSRHCGLETVVSKTLDTNRLDGGWMFRDVMRGTTF